MKLTHEEKIALRVAVKHTLFTYRSHFWNNVKDYHNTTNKEDKQGSFNRCIFWNREAVELKKALEKIT